MPESIKHNASIISKIIMSYCKQKCMALKKVDRTVDAAVGHSYLTQPLLWLTMQPNS